jgi:hypothetical protein
MKIQHVSYGQRIRDLALSFPETYENSPWGHPVFKVGDNKMFAAMSDGDDPVSLTVKLTAEEREIALHMPVCQYRAVRRTLRLGHRHRHRRRVARKRAGMAPRELLAQGAGEAAKRGGRDLTIPRPVVCGGVIVDEIPTRKSEWEYEDG